MKVQRSIVKWFDAKKGYGFILNPDGGVDVFVHYSQIVSDERFKTLRTGEIVDYELHDGTKGLHAQNIKGTNEVVNLDASGSPVKNTQPLTTSLEPSGSVKTAPAESQVSNAPLSETPEPELEPVKVEEAAADSL